MSNKHKWYTVTDKGWYSIDFAISENTNEKDEPLIAMQIYSTEKGDNEMIGNIYLDEESLAKMIKDLNKVKRRMRNKS
jgi:hypothetical protein